MSLNFLSFEVNGIWMPKAISDSSWPSSPSSSREKTLSSKKTPVSLSFTISQPSPYSNMPPSQSTPLSISVTLPSPSMSSPNLSPSWPSSTTISHSLPKSLKRADNPEKAGNKKYNNLNYFTNPRFKTKTCRGIKERCVCLHKNLCKFSHSLDEKKDVVNNNKDKNHYKFSHSLEETKDVVNNKKDKSVLCHKYWTNGYSLDETKDVVNNNKDKVALCHKYWTNGYCAHGPNCSKVHGENVRNTLANRSLSKEILSYLSPVESLVDNDIQVMKHNAIIYRDVYDSGNSTDGSCSKSHSREFQR